MAELLYAQEYEAFIVDSATQATLVALPWSAIKWQRIRNEISAGSVTVAQADGGAECCGIIGNLFPWSQSLRIERNGEPVWDGPVTGWNRPGKTRDLTVRAMDRSVIMQKRLVHTHRIFTSVTPYSIIYQLMIDCGMANPAFDPYPLSIPVMFPPAERATREYFVERLERVYDVVKELIDNTYTGFFTCATDSIYLDETTIANYLGTAATGKAPKLNEFTTIGLPGLDVDGLSMATIIYAGGAGQGINGFPLIATNNGNTGVLLTGLLERAASETLSATSTDLGLIAGRGAAESLAPATTLEQIQLSPLFGSEFMHANLDNLLPGAQFDLDYAETCVFDIPVAEYRETAGTPGVAYTTRITRARMDQLDVSVGKTEGGGITEDVTGSFRPIISTVLTDAIGALPAVGASAPASQDVVDGGVPSKRQQRRQT